MEKNKGRPEGKPYPVVKQLRLSTQDAIDLAALVKEWRCTEAEAMRRALREAAKRESLPEPAQEGGSE